MAGMGGLIAATDKPSVAQVKAAQYLEEAQEDYVTRQFESVLNYIINHLSGVNTNGNYIFGVAYLHSEMMWLV